MRKIDYSKIKWGASTNWEFCGSKENLKEVHRRASGHRGVRLSIEEFGYNRPDPGYAYEKGDVVNYNRGDNTMFAVVDTPVGSDGHFYVRVPEGHRVVIHPNDIVNKVTIADIPDELMALARAEAGKPIDFSKCPLKDQGVCMKGGDV
jgi:hypothetical protein